MRGGNSLTRHAGLAAVAAASALIVGCGTPGAPLPPSLKLPQPVTDLTAVRTGDTVTLRWMTPAKNTDKLLLPPAVPAHICRRLDDSPCIDAGVLNLAPGKPAEFTETLPSDLPTGPPRTLTYFVELLSPRGRSAGESNAAATLAGQAPAAPANLRAEPHPGGVVLRWTAQPGGASLRLLRKLVSASPKAAKSDAMAQTPEPENQNLLVAAPQNTSAFDHALDATARFGATYEYRAQLVYRVFKDGQMLELAGPISSPVTIEVKDAFPPAVPQGLVAVYTPAANGSAAAIDLNWQPNTDERLAGYVVYRMDGTDAAWQRISGAQPVVGSAYHDATVAPGHSYQYAVSAIGLNSQESARSAAAEETAPAE